MQYVQYICLSVQTTTTSGSASRESTDDVITGSRGRRRVYDWNTKRHFYPDIIDVDTTSSGGPWAASRGLLLVQTPSGSSSGRHQSSTMSTSSSVLLQQTATTIAAAGQVLLQSCPWPVGPFHRPKPTQRGPTPIQR